MRKVVVSGTRSFTDYQKFKDFLEAYMPYPCTIIHGACRGVDTLAGRYGVEKGLEVITFPADWDKHGRGAGLLRNVEMARETDMLMAVWDKQSRGTRHMMRAVYDMQKPIIWYNYLEDQVTKYNFT